MKMPEYINFSKLHNALNPKWFWPVILVVSAMGTGVLFFVDGHSPLRPFVVLWFLMVCPGMAVVRIFNVHEILLEWVLALSLSISLAGIISSIMIYTHIWSPGLGLGILITITVAGVVVQTLLNLRIISWPVSEISIPVKRDN